MGSMKLLITGSDGYIGMQLGRVLMQHGYSVVGLDTGFYNESVLYKGFAELPKVIHKDIRAIAPGDLTGIDAVIHLAELSNDSLGKIDPKVTYEINHQGTVALAKKAKNAGIRTFIYFSSCSVYGASDLVSSEKSAAHPLTEYAKCKVLNEHALSEMADQNFSPVFLRNATAYGPSPHMRFDLVINNLCGLAFTTKQIAMESDGMPWRPFVHVLDICEAVRCVLEAPVKIIHNEIFNVGDTNANYQIKDIANIISECMPTCSVTLNKQGVDKRNYKVNFHKINSKLPGFSCTRTVRTGIVELLDLFKKIHLKKDIFLSKNFYRIRQIEFLRNTNAINSDLFWET